MLDSGHLVAGLLDRGGVGGAIAADIEEFPSAGDEEEDKQGAVDHLPKLPSVDGDAIGDREEEREKEDGSWRCGEGREEPPTNQRQRKCERGNIVFDKTRIEEDHADEQDGNPLAEREAAAQEVPGEIKEKTQQGKRVAEIEDDAGERVRDAPMIQKVAEETGRAAAEVLAITEHELQR